jgi:Sulfate permease family
MTLRCLPELAESRPAGPRVRGLPLRINRCALAQGLYGAFVPVFMYAIFGSSPHLAVGPVAVTSLLLGKQLPKIVSGADQIEDSSDVPDELKGVQEEYNQAALQARAPVCRVDCCALPKHLRVCGQLSERCAQRCGAPLLVVCRPHARSLHRSCCGLLPASCAYCT